MPSNIPARELRIMRLNTVAFIDGDPRAVVLWRPTRVSTGTGGTAGGGWAEQASQTMRLLPQDASVSTERKLASGAVVRATWVLLARWDANLRRGDAVDLPNGEVGEVVYVHEKDAYQKKGEVAARGPR